MNRDKQIEEMAKLLGDAEDMGYVEFHYEAVEI